jgi:hypothetical protein
MTSQVLVRTICAITRDSLLDAVATGKRLALGVTWTGASKPEFDQVIDDLEALSTPLSDPSIGGRELEAEGPDALINMGQVYDGLRQIVRGEQRQGLDVLRRVVSDARRKLAARGVSSRDQRLTSNRLIGDFSAPVTPDSLNEQNRVFWEKQTQLNADPAARTQDSRERNAEKLAEQRAGR